MAITAEAAVQALRSDPRPLRDYVLRQRWFGSKGRAIDHVSLHDYAVLPAPHPTVLAIVHIGMAAGPAETYFVPLTILPIEQAADHDLRIEIEGQSCAVTDAAAQSEAALMLMDGLRRACVWKTGHGTFSCQPTAEGQALLDPPPRTAKRLSGEQSNTSVLYDRRVMLKIVRKLQAGINPDREILDFLTSRTDYRHVPILVGAIEYEGPSDTGVFHTTAGIAETFIPNAGDAWGLACDHATSVLHELRGTGLDGHTLTTTVARLSEHLLDGMRQLGVITAQLHAALASDSTMPAFRAEPIVNEDLSRWQSGVRAQIRDAFRLLRHAHERCRLSAIPETNLEGVESACLDHVKHWTGSVAEYGCKIRIHGDYHLGQVLAGDEEQTFAILDFEGEPARSLEERRAKMPALKDVAGMVRSFDYAGHTALRTHAHTLEASTSAQAMRLWTDLTTEAFLRGYRAVAVPGQAAFVPTTDEAFSRLMKLFLLEKAAYELAYELNNRPDWVDIPLGGLRRLAQDV